MRTVTVKRNDTGEECEIEIRSLKRKEIKALKDLGYNYLGCVPKYDTAEDSVDKALEFVLSEDEQKFLDECENSETVKVWKELLKETYGDKGEEKNSKTTTDTTQTEKE